MNTKNNKRKRDSIERIERAFVNLIQTKELHTVSVSDICKIADLNRSTFYANFEDIYDLADKIRENLESEFSSLFDNSYETRSGNQDAVRMFQHIKDNQLFYKTYFKLGYENNHKTLTYDINQAERDFAGKHIDYHIEFFKAGLNAIIKRWLERECAESPEEMAQILSSEYKGRTLI